MTFYTQDNLHTWNSIHMTFHTHHIPCTWPSTHKIFYTHKILCTSLSTRMILYTRRILHTWPSTHHILHTWNSTHHLPRAWYSTVYTHHIHITLCHPHDIGWLRSVVLIKWLLSSAEYRLFYRALLQTRPIISSILLTKATRYHPHCIQLSSRISFPRITFAYTCQKRHVYICQKGRVYVSKEKCV